MEMGKHIIVFITAILMPFMAYGDDSATNATDKTCADAVAEVAEDKKEGICNQKPGCGWVIFGDLKYCAPCSVGYYNSGDGQGCQECNKDGLNFLAKDFIHEGEYSLTIENITGLTSNACPYWIKCREDEEYLPNDKKCDSCTAGLYNDTPIYVFKGEDDTINNTCSPKTFNITLKYQIKSANGCTPPNTDPQEIGKEKVEVSLLPTYNETELLISAQKYTEKLRNQYNLASYDSYPTLSYTDADTNTSETCRVYKTNINADGTPYQLGYKAEVDNCKDLLEAAPHNAELTLTVPVTQKKFQYALVPMNSVKNGDDGFSVSSAKNASGVKTGCFGNQIKLENTDEKATYYQYNNCAYDTGSSTVNCEFETKPTTPIEPTTTGEPTNDLYLTLDYGFTYTDNTIIVLERATGCPAGQYCPTYTTTGDKPCPAAFWSDENAISETDCYLDKDVIFFDNNTPDDPDDPDDGIKLIEDGTKLFYTPMNFSVEK